ncbi:MAG: hypothetical protein QHI38_03215 [Armatimonadota bacterium]|nr:hypothetical protein [Armatimonadota bacterium]
MSLSLFVPSQSEPITRNAAHMIRGELKQRFGCEVSVADWNISGCKFQALALGWDYNFSCEKAKDVLLRLCPQGSEGFHISPVPGGAVLAGNTGSGVLYAADHLLDTIRWDEAGRPTQPVDEVIDRPDCEIRGATFTTYAHPRFMEDPADLEGMKSLIRYYARNRLNMITVEATGKRWPGDLTPLVTFKHFEPLQDSNRDEAVAKRRAMMNDLIAYAHSWGIKVVLYTSEFNHDPDVYERCPELHGVLPKTWSEGRHNYVHGCMCLSKNIVWQYLRAKIKETAEALPELDGLELWMAEVPSEFGICACPACRSKPRHEWIERLISEVRAALDEVSPRITLYVKTFQSSQGALEVERFAPLKGKIPHDTYISCKAQWGDMAYLNDPHPLLGWIQDGAEVAEFDVGGEYCGCGLGAMICCIPEYIAERLRLYYSKGVRKFLARHAVPQWPNKQFMDINDLAFFRLAWDVDTDVEQLWETWASERFGSAAESMIRLLKLSDDVVSKALYVRRACANRHYYIFCDTIDSLKYMMFDLSAFMIDGALEQLEPTSENIQAIIAEKEEAVAACAQMLAEYRTAVLGLDEETAAKLQFILTRTERIVAVMRKLTEAFFTYLRWERTWSVREKDELRPCILDILCECEREIDKALELPEEVWQGRRLWNLRKVVDFERARRLCEEIRGALNFRLGQRADFAVSITPSTVGHPNTYANHRLQLRSIFGLPGEG